MNTKPLLIIGCSASKLETKAPALDLYQGSIFTMLRANIQDLREVFEVVILSAEHSHIHQDSVIEFEFGEQEKSSQKECSSSNANGVLKLKKWAQLTVPTW